jgi:hypothetical protein
MKNPKSRVRDLVDLVLLAGSNKLIPEKTRRAILGSFNRRATHPIPPLLQSPPAVWEKPFVALSAECGLQIGIEEAFRTAEIFFRSLQILAQPNLSISGRLHFFSRSNPKAVGAAKLSFHIQTELGLRPKRE